MFKPRKDQSFYLVNKYMNTQLVGQWASQSKGPPCIPCIPALSPPPKLFRKCASVSRPRILHQPGAAMKAAVSWKETETLWTHLCNRRKNTLQGGEQAEGPRRKSTVAISAQFTQPWGPSLPRTNKNPPCVPNCVTVGF